MKNLNFAECWYECLDLLPIYIWMLYNWSAPKTCGWLLKILWDWEEFEVAWIIIKGLLARSWDVTTDFFTTQFSVFEGGWPKRITISLLLTKPIFILLFNEIVSHVLQHDTKSWMNWSMWVWKRRMTDSKQIDFNVRLWRHQGWQSRWRPRPLYWAVHIHRGTFIGKTCLLPSSRWENFSLKFWELRIFVCLRDGLTIEGTKNSPPLWFNWILLSTFWVCGSLEVEKMQRELVFLLFQLVQVIWNFLIACSQC